MTFTEIVTEITDRLNITSSASTARIGREVNRYYKRLTTSLNLKTSRRTTVTGNTSIGSQTVTFTSVEKIDRVVDNSASEWCILDEKTYDELRDRKAVSGVPTKWAVKTRGATSVVILLDTLASDVRTLTADGETTVSTLSGSDVPAFPESFHTILVDRVLADEYKKSEKGDLARIALADYEQGLSDLKMYIAKQAYLLIRQGETPRNKRTSRNRIS